MIGSISLWNFSLDKKTAEVGYDLGTNFHNKGIMSEAMKCVLDYGFTVLNLDKIEAFTHGKNQSSVRMLVKNGFVLVNGKTDPGNENNIIFELRKSV